MLQKLHIQNYAIIDELVIAFPVGLNIITGETGAGKSILMGALGLILGERADSNVLLDRNKKCVVEGSFVMTGKQDIGLFLQAHDLDAGLELMIRREIAANGKSRAFINDTPVNLSQLQELSSLLVDLHQQFDTLAIGETGFQREVIDALAAHNGLLEEYKGVWQQLQQAARALKELRLKKDQFAAMLDYNQFLFSELEEAGLKENEIEDAEAELKLLNNSEGIKAALARVSYELNEADTPVVQQLKVLVQQLQPYADTHPALPVVIQRILSVQLELKDIAGEVEHISDHVQYDPARIELLNDKISTGYRLLKKHHVLNTTELLAVKQDLQEKLFAVMNIDDNILDLDKKAVVLRTRALELARKISTNRHKQVKPLEEKVNKLLAKVGMPNARLKVQIETSGADAAVFNDSGMDTMEFLFDGNRSNQFAPVRKVASGGELSRLMLCIKSLVAESIDLPTMIFDEIDTGISGEAARQVGIILKDLSAKRQIICITHQPQIAGKGGAHFYVYKEITANTVKTNIRLLTQDERITAIAKMLSGEKPTAAALENAREMVMN
ncbi:MAG: DNA repair protein RecN [Chitinophagaceae bacterium]|nr:DNA repair protein RecN [Chitinophagaceae bacterium]